MKKYLNYFFIISDELDLITSPRVSLTNRVNIAAKIKATGMTLNAY